MVTMEVNLKEGDKEPEQHLDEGEFIERRIVPLTELYGTLQGKSKINICCQTLNANYLLQRSRKKRARLSMPGKSA